MSRKSVFFGVVLASGLMSGLLGYHFYLGPKVIPIPKELFDPLQRYRFQGTLGDAITSFEDNTGANWTGHL